MNTPTIKLPMLTIAGLVTTGLLALPIAAFAADGDQAVKRDEDTPDVVLVADEDDADSGDNTGDNTDDDSNTGSSRATGDNTRSNFTAVSRDNDLSRSDKTRDKTQDGPGGTKRDWSGNKTNDASRNDSR